ncbi:MAG: D-alanyl-D-alanine carboxypeptidase family protein [Bacteroidales bacterium]|jgi:D-alanyl-D-alanine dipeptidase|nr:D-alanyl-D-alanine carboxypeptidase family protein [Bacteroidales bacterium]
MLNISKRILFTLILTIGIYQNFSNSQSNNSIFKHTERPIFVNKNTGFTNYESKLESLGFVEIIKYIPYIQVDIKYATENNFVKYNFYGDNHKAYVLPECLNKLIKAYEILQTLRPNYSFVIFDAVRSVEAQQIMYDSNIFDSLKIPQNQKYIFVAKPGTSLHNYGMAIDLSIIDTENKLLNMGTNFDYFGELAKTYRTEDMYKLGRLSKEQYENRQLLFSVMKQAGFTVAQNEWWHFNACTYDYAKANCRMFCIN